MIKGWYYQHNLIFFKQACYGTWKNYLKNSKKTVGHLEGFSLVLGFIGVGFGKATGSGLRWFARDWAIGRESSVSRFGRRCGHAIWLGRVTGKAKFRGAVARTVHHVAVGAVGGREARVRPWKTKKARGVARIWTESSYHRRYLSFYHQPHEALVSRQHGYRLTVREPTHVHTVYLTQTQKHHTNDSNWTKPWRNHNMEIYANGKYQR